MRIERIAAWSAVVGTACLAGLWVWSSNRFTTRDPEPEPVAPPQPPARVEPVGNVRGRIVDAIGHGLADCVITFEPAVATPTIGAPRRGEVAPLSVETTDDGRFAAQIDSRGPFAVVAVHRDFPPQILTTALTLRDGEIEDLGALTLRSERGLVVHVTDRSGRGVANARLVVAPLLYDPALGPRNLARLDRQAVTDETGRAVFRGVAAGAYRLRVESPDHATRVVRHVQSATLNRTPRLRIELEPGSVLRGRVVDHLGRAVTPASLTARPVGGGVEVRGLVDDRGEFRLVGLSQSTYRVEVSYERGRLGATTELPRSDGLEFRAPPSRHLHGRLLDADGRPAAGARLAARPALDPVAPPLLAWTDGRGEFAIRDAAPGRFRLRAASDEPLPGGLPTFVSTAPDQPAPVDVRRPPEARVHGALQFAGTPIENAIIELMHETYDGTAAAASALATRRATGATTRSDATGRFELATRAGRGRLRLRSAGRPTLLTRVLDLGGGTVDLGAIEWPRGAIVTGTATLADGRPAAGATVCLDPYEPTAAAVAAAAVAGPDGRFSVGPVTAGRYEMFYFYAARRAVGEESECIERTRIELDLPDGEDVQAPLVMR